jgi:Dolichyl-phosphate-mannose-protein mannosyltransferase
MAERVWETTSPPQLPVMTRGALWAAGIAAAFIAVAHLATAGRYDFFVNELYFIVCGRHPAFGYVDQPPVIPLLSALTQVAGTHVWLLRLPAVLAAILLVPLTVAFAQLLGATTRGAWLAAVAAAASPMLTAMTATLTTSALEPLAWTAIAYCVTRAVVRTEPRMWWWAGAVAGLTFETRYGVIIWLIAIALGLVVSTQRTSLRSTPLAVGIALGALIALPNAAWQLFHGLPFLEVIHNDNADNFTGTPLVFAIDQIFSLNFLLAPLWVSGIVAPFVSPRLARFRFLAIAFVAAALLVFLTHGKNYYLAGAYPTMFALGAAACTALPRLLVAAWSVLAFVYGVLALPLVLPIYSPAKLKTTVEQMPIKLRPIEKASVGAPLTQVFSYEFGWRELAASVESVFASLSPADRARAAIFASSYFEAAAVDVFGSGLPPALSGNNQYYLWGPRGYDGAVVIAVNVDPAVWSGRCDSLRVAAHYGESPYVMPREHDRPIFVCRGLHPPLTQLWPQLKFYGI